MTKKTAAQEAERLLDRLEYERLGVLALQDIDEKLGSIAAALEAIANRLGEQVQS